MCSARDVAVLTVLKLDIEKQINIRVFVSIEEYVLKQLGWRTACPTPDDFLALLLGTVSGQLSPLLCRAADLCVAVCPSRPSIVAAVVLKLTSESKRFQAKVLGNLVDGFYTSAVQIVRISPLPVRRRR